MTIEPDLEDLRLEKLASLSGRIRENIDAFQPIADRAKSRFAVPIAIVSVIDAKDQIYLGSCGVTAPSCPRDQTFCTYTILSPSVVVVEDTLQHPRFATHPLVVRPPKLRFYAGAPITVDHHVRLGTVCLADTRPRVFSRGDKMVLEHLAALVVHVLLTLPERREAVTPATPPVESAAAMGEASDAAGRSYVRAWKPVAR